MLIVSQSLRKIYRVIHLGLSCIDRMSSKIKDSLNFKVCTEFDEQSKQTAFDDFKSNKNHRTSKTRNVFVSSKIFDACDMMKFSEFGVDFFTKCGINMTQ